MRSILRLGLIAAAFVSVASALDQNGMVLAEYQRLKVPMEGAESSNAPVEVGRMMADIQALERMPRFDGSGRGNAVTYIEQQLDQAGWSHEQQPIHVDGNLVGANVVATHPGSDPSKGAIVLGAHFDSFWGSPGADDNASGVAAVLEAGRMWTQYDYPNLRTIHLVFFDQEETMGKFFGSRQFVESPKGKGVKAAIVLEGMGRTCSGAGCQKFPPDLPTPPPDDGQFLAMAVDIEHVELLDVFRGTAQPELPLYLLAVPDGGRRYGSLRRSDHVPFWEAGIGAVVLTDTAVMRTPDYHKDSDTSDKIDQAYLTRTTRAALDGLYVMANYPGL